MATKEMLPERIIQSLEAQGFLTNPYPHPDGNSKKVYRLLREKARLERVNEHQGFLVKYVEIASKFLRLFSAHERITGERGLGDISIRVK